MIPIDNKFNFKDVVYLKTDKDQSPRLVTAIQISPNGLIYRLACGSSESWHYDFEITVEKNILINTES